MGVFKGKRGRGLRLALSKRSSYNRKSKTSFLQFVKSPINSPYPKKQRLYSPAKERSSIFISTPLPQAIHHHNTEKTLSCISPILQGKKITV